MRVPGMFEFMILLLLKERGGMLGMDVCRACAVLTGQERRATGIYIVLKRMEERGFLETEKVRKVTFGKGRPRFRYSITPAGIEFLRHITQILKQCGIAALITSQELIPAEPAA